MFEYPLSRTLNHKSDFIKQYINVSKSLISFINSN